jgi:hypothetical protein
MSKLVLDNVTLMSFYSPFNDNFDNQLFDETINSLKTSMSQAEFKKTILLTSELLCSVFHSKLLELNIDCQPCDSKINNVNDYSKYMVYDLYKHFDTEFILTTQHDGYVINPHSWTNEFLEYDYIGAPWPIREQAYISPFNENIRVGNGGFSLRSKKLTLVPQEVEVPFDCTTGDFYKHFNQNNFNEDGCISVHNRHIFESAGCRFAPVNLASKFSQELDVPENLGVLPFGFHKFIPRGFNV